MSLKCYEIRRLYVSFEQTCICLTHWVYKVWKWLYICENEATIDYHNGSAVKLGNTCHRYLTQRWVIWSSLVVPKVWKYGLKSKQGWRRVKNGSCRGDPSRSCVFSKLPLLFFVCSVGGFADIEKSTYSNLLPKATRAVIIFSYVAWGLGRCLRFLHQTQMWMVLKKVWKQLI